MKTHVLIGVGVVLLLIGAVGTALNLQPEKEATVTPPLWSAEEVVLLRSLWIGSLPPLPPDPSNRYRDDPRAAALGEQLFFDTRFSANGAVACATCHDPELGFQDGLPLAQGIGTTTRRTMPLMGTAYSPWFFWDGRKDSQWGQALGPLENPVEHGGNRTQYAHLIMEYYRDAYEAIFGELPDLSELPSDAAPLDDPVLRAAWDGMSADEQEAVTRIYVNMGKAIAAYERGLMPEPTRFDEYVAAVLENDTAQMEALFTEDEVAGLRLFIGAAHCAECHNGPLLTDTYFHNTGVPVVEGLPTDTGRTLGAQQVLADEFNCQSVYSDTDNCPELRFMIAEGDMLLRAYKPPSLRGVASRPPYMHAGQFATLEEVLTHYLTAPFAPAGRSELHLLLLSEREIAQLIAFLRTLG